ncbi:hypothetical protein, partial [Nocardia macrotermitis]|uniref:hypothetical protein n=1 Tax=Nocardia macrotermitis TaxID=2585198 RepID=UPI001885B645
MAHNMEGKVGHYWTVPPLTVPPGASTALKTFLLMAHEAIQTAVDLLGRDMPELPPSVDSLMQPVVYTDLGKGEGTTSYKQALTKVQNARTSLLEYDHKVAATVLDVADGHSETLAEIKDIVEKLNTALASVPAGALKGHEPTVMKYVASGVDAVYKKVEAVYAYNENLAGGSSGNGSDNGASGSGSGSGSSSGSTSTTGTSSGDGLSGLLSAVAPLAMMIPVGLMALAPTVMQMMQQNQEKEKEEKEKAAQAAQNGTGQPAPTQQNPATPATAPTG